MAGTNDKNTIMEHSKETIAMLIDADNSPSDKIDYILAEMAKYGVVNIRRAYGNWKSRSLKGWEDKLHDYAIRPIQQFDYTKGKNATDMAMTIDGMDLLYGSKLDAFCIVSSDSDFTPLVMRILSEGLNVYGFGQKSTPSPFVNACSTFLYLESFGGQAQERSRSDGGRRKSPQELKSDSKLLTLVRNAVDSAQEDDGWSNLAKIGKNISNQASFDPRNYGFKRLSDLIRSIDLFDTEFRNNNSELYIRDKRKARRPEQGMGEAEMPQAGSEPAFSRPAYTRQEAPRQEFSRQEPTRREFPKQEFTRQESLRPESPRQESSRPESTRQESPRQESPREASPRQESPRPESPRQESSRPESPRSDSPKQESPKQEPPKQESPRRESPKPKAPRQEARKPAVPKQVVPEAEVPGPVPAELPLPGASTPAEPPARPKRKRRPARRKPETEITPATPDSTPAGQESSPEE
jgi:uncharacterized LabA/DUF88 family protein